MLFIFEKTEEVLKTVTHAGVDSRSLVEEGDESRLPGSLLLYSLAYPA